LSGKNSLISSKGHISGHDITALFLCALAVAGAIYMTLELTTPFRGIIRISSTPMKEALDEISLK
jgi:hypothetical protein